MTDIPPQSISYFEPATMPYARLRNAARTFGVIAIVLGSLSGCIGLLSPLQLIVRRPPRPGMVISETLFYGAYALAWFVFGIGATQLRRWARPLAVAGGTLCALAGMVFLLT